MKTHFTYIAIFEQRIFYINYEANFHIDKESLYEQDIRLLYLEFANDSK